MSKKKTPEAYRKTFAFRFFRWIGGEKDPYLGEVEMQPQEEYHVDPEALLRHEKEHDAILDKVYDTEHNKGLRLFNRLYQVTSILFCLFLIALLLVTVSYLPAVGTVTRPVNNEVAKRYIEDGLEETGAVNIVAGMILDYRAFDTLGESHVLFVATITVLILLRLNKGQEAKSDRLFEPKNDTILQLVATFLVPIIIIFGIYIILNGHLGPGGGFSGGAVIGAGLVLYLNAFGFAKTERFFTEKTYKWVCFFSLSFYCLAKSYSFYTGANELHSVIPKGTPGAILSSGLILPLNIAVGLVVACTIYAFYAMFRKGGF
ncbi:MAG: hypothetical protein NC302_10950 [Bacteroidales bacterium]|nr:hypothetical protein [Bacteroidales bacterium]MCM1416603.1 hypothetical protein [bacterium]MCM1424825.1 hypothetical protein [bacterium]